MHSFFENPFQLVEMPTNIKVKKGSVLNQKNAIILKLANEALRDWVLFATFIVCELRFSYLVGGLKKTKMKYIYSKK